MMKNLHDSPPRTLRKLLLAAGCSLLPLAASAQTDTNAAVQMKPTVVTGSFNFSTSADKSNDENVVIFKNNAEIARRFEEEFQRVYGAALKVDQGGPVAHKK